MEEYVISPPAGLLFIAGGALVGFLYRHVTVRVDEYGREVSLAPDDAAGLAGAIATYRQVRNGGQA